jgi:hypothetical protein
MIINLIISHGIIQIAKSINKWNILLENKSDFFLLLSIFISYINKNKLLHYKLMKFL